MLIYGEASMTFIWKIRLIKNMNIFAKPIFHYLHQNAYASATRTCSTREKLIYIERIKFRVEISTVAKLEP